jgi:hypothetical protein
VKIALYIEDGLEQIVLTPQSDTEKAILAKLHDGSRAMTLAKGSFYECRGGYARFTPYWQSMAYGGSSGGDESTMVVLRPMPPEQPTVPDELRDE